MIDKRTGWLLFIVIALIIIRVGVSWQGSESSTPFFQIGEESYELDSPEQRKVLMLKNHPTLEQTSSTQPSESGKTKLSSYKRNPFLYGRPPAPKRPVVKIPVIVPKTNLQQKTEAESRFSGKLFGYTERLSSGTKTVMLETAEETLYLKEGELIDKRYAIKEITTEYIIILDQKSGQELVLTYLDGP